MKQKKIEIIFQKKKSDVEKLISDLKYNSKEDLDRIKKKDFETQTGRLQNVEKDLKEQVSQLKQNEDAAIKRYKAKSTELKNLQKSISTLQTEKETLENNLQKLQSSLSDEQNDLITQKKNQCRFRE